MKSRKLGFAILAALSLQAQPRWASTATNTSTVNMTNTTNTVSNIRHFEGDVSSPIQAGSREIAVGSPYPLEVLAAGISEGRRKKNKKKIKKNKKNKKKMKKFKNPSMNMMIGGSMMAAFVMIFTFMNMITVTLGKALFFTFIAKFLISVNWKSSESSSKKKTSHNDITVLMT